MTGPSLRAEKKVVVITSFGTNKKLSGVQKWLFKRATNTGIFYMEKSPNIYAYDDS